MKNIYLIGLPGVGKSKIGYELSKKLNKKFVDMDQEISKKENKTINEIFNTNGENYFRDLETTLLKSLIEESDLVVATGGGIVVNKENKELLNGTVIYLKGDLNIINQRANSETRPLLKTKSVFDLYNERHKLYLDFSNIVVLISPNIRETIKYICEVIDENINN